jgi:hypothetical protein
VSRPAWAGQHIKDPEATTHSRLTLAKGIPDNAGTRLEVEVRGVGKEWATKMRSRVGEAPKRRQLSLHLGWDRRGLIAYY